MAVRSARLVAAALSGLLLHLERAGVRGGRAQPGKQHNEQPHLTNMAQQQFPSTGAILHDGLPMPTQVSWAGCACRDVLPVLAGTQGRSELALHHSMCARPYAAT